MKHLVKHDLSIARAKAVIEAMFSNYASSLQKYHPHLSWRDAQSATISFLVKGKTLTGDATVSADGIQLNLEVPFLFRLFEGEAIRRIDEQAKVWIAKAHAGEI